MKPITRKELYLNKIVGNDDYDIPEKPITTEEFFFAEILGEAVQTPEPLSRYQIYLAKIAGRNISVPKPLTRLELFLAKACGMDIETPTPITREEIYWSNYTAIVELEVEGVPPLTYKAIEGTLENYRIYGNTVDGESVGDRTGNLFYKKIGNANISSRGGVYTDVQFNLWIGKVTAGETYTARNMNLVVGFFTDEPDFGVYTYNNSRIADASPVYTFTVPSGCSYVAIRFFKNEPTFMLNSGSTPLPYEPYGYKVPVTVSNGTDTQIVPLYLPEQIRKIGDEAEYIDYAEQKQHRVRKNLLQNTATSQTIEGVTVTVNEDGSITCNGTANSERDTYARIYIAQRFYFDDETIQYTLTGSPYGGSQTSFLLEYSNAVNKAYQTVGNGVTFTPFNKSDYPNAWVRIKIHNGYTCNNLTFYPMIRKADIEDDTYEPYIENTDLDVTLPALPTIKGTNVLSVGTEVQPSKVYVKYKGERQ